ncbi:LytR C-terminal domain-containing protein [Pseudoglutamicibacter cumminsii]|uniref:LytR C-terminal domain-containing protein n=1 Tax=Pseudoglutamicibacter cumminsii TaxID=156979 RepID=UPI0021A9308E|nr:LytR C-terminal domain-containing protein [Pseudoglutamicibacter cumminsii]MCT1686932.1 LytR C-terminal domain-containing protein [Pseudoglutamicibacter cumminsii]
MGKRYPTDEFDSVPQTPKRAGAHRSWAVFPHPAKRLRSILIVGAFVLAVGILMFAVVRPWSAEAFGDLKKDEQQAEQPQASGSEEESPSTGPSDEPSGESSASDGAESDGPSDAADTSASASDDAESGAPSEEELAVPLWVYNANGNAALTQDAVTHLTEEGFQPVAGGQWSRIEDTSTVYYKNEADGALAAKIAGKLKISGTYQHQNIPQDITVVIGSDYTPR